MVEAIPLVLTYLLSGISLLNPRDPPPEPFIALVCENSPYPSDPVAAFQVKPTQDFDPRRTAVFLALNQTHIPYRGACLYPLTRRYTSIDQNGDVKTAEIENYFVMDLSPSQQQSMMMLTARLDYLSAIQQERRNCEEYVEAMVQSWFKNPRLRKQLRQNMDEMIKKHNQQAKREGASWQASFVDPGAHKGRCPPSNQGVQKPAWAFQRMNRL